VGRSIRDGWEVFKANALYLIVVFVIVSAVYGVIERAEAFEDRYPFPVGLMIRFGALIAMAVVEIAIINVAVRMARGAEATFDHLVSGLPVFVKYLIGSIFYWILIVVGLFVLVIPGIYLAIKYGFFGYLIVEEDIDPLEAFKLSARMTDGIKIELFFYYILLVLINVLGLLCFAVGIFVSWPVTRVALANVYLQLREQVGGEAGGPGAAQV
jgi:hypothetical protein